LQVGSCFKIVAVSKKKKEEEGRRRKKKEEEGRRRKKKKTDKVYIIKNRTPSIRIRKTYSDAAEATRFLE
jgi:hypothetical protein